MLAIAIILLSVAVVGAQKPKPPACPDIPPTTQFPCEFEVAVGHCEAHNNDALKLNGQLVYCLKSCGFCDKIDLSKLPPKIVPRDQLKELAQGPGNFAGAYGSAQSYSEMVDQIEGNFTSAVADLTSADLGIGSSRQDAVVEAAVATTQAIATAIASAASSVSLQGVTNSVNSKATGLARAQAESIANATASAYAVAIAEAGQEFTDTEASIMVNDVQQALTSASADFRISGVTEVTAQFNAYSEAVAEALANATAKAFAKITGFEYSAIAFATAQAFNSSEIPCLSICNNASPEDNRTCQSYVDNDECGAVVGFCECACGTCQIGSEAYVSSFTNIISNDDTQQVVNALGEAFSQGAKGADAVASAFVEAVSQGKAEAVSTAIAEAFGAQEISSTAIAEAVTIAINQGGTEVTSAVADAFALAERGGNSEALAEAIATSFTSEDVDDAQAVAMTDALATAITDGGCEAISLALTEAEAIAEKQGDGPAFASAMAVSDTINSCLSGNTAEAVSDDVQTVTEVESIASGGNSMSTAQALAQNLQNNQIRASADAIAKAVAEGNSEAIASGIGIALSDGAATKAIVEAIAVAINEGTNSTVTAVAEAFAQAENSYSDALSNVLSVGLLEGGDSAQAFAAVVSQAISEGGCQALAKSLASALAQAEAQGKGQVIANVLPPEAAECLGMNGALAASVANAVVNGDDNAVLVLAAQAIQEDQLDDFMKGLEQAKNLGGSCENISDALVATAQLNNSQALSSAMLKVQTVADCVGNGLNFCPGLVGRDCCASEEYPQECRCTRFSCRASLNKLLSIPELGLYVYNDVGNRKCKCPINVSTTVD